MQNTSNIITNVPQKGLVTDLHDNLVSKEVWSHARNAQMNSHIGQLWILQNEPSTELCVDLPYPAIGFIRLLNDKWAVFLSDDVTSEIGIFDQKACTYDTLVKDACLNFKRTNPIMGISKENFDCTETIYWTDNLNPRRLLNISNIPRKYTIDDDDCETKIYTTELDCVELLLEPRISIPTVAPRLSTSGNLKNGTYQFVIAYLQNSVRVTEYHSVSKPVRVWSHENRGQSIELSIDDLDRDFDEFELVVIYTKDESPAYLIVGQYSTATNNILVSNVTRTENTPISLKDILTRRPRYPYAELVTANDQYALWGNVTTKPELNYQLQAMNIKSEYVMFKVPEDYYSKGGVEVGYERDEIYSFGIQWLYADGSWSPVYHIPGRTAEGNELELAAGTDVYEYLVEDPTCPVDHTIKVWEVENTAGISVPISSTAVCDEQIVARGEMAYWESTDLYPDNETLFGDSKCTPIRHHKFPDNNKARNHTQDGKYINVLGIRFSDIERPKNSDGTYNSEVVGHRIVRGDRKNDRSVIAKGLISNVRSYREVDGKEVFYSNYPYNDLRPDNFISNRQTEHKSGGEKKFSPVTNYKGNMYNLHAPHALFGNTSLGDELVVYTEEVADVTGKFEEVYRHPKQKLLTQFDLYFALILGALDGYYAQQGRKCTTIVDNHTITLGSIQTPGGPTPPQTVIIHRTKEESACDDALSFTSSLTVNNRQVRAAERVLRTLARAGVFAYFTLQTAQKVLDIIGNFNGWQQYGMQYNSVGNFNRAASSVKDHRRRHIDYYQYIRDGINTVEGTTFNNYKRETSVFLRLNKDLKNPTNLDNSRQTLSEFGICDNKFNTVASTAAMYHVGVKRKVPNQYGSLDGIRYFDTGYLDNELDNVSPVGVTDVMYRTSAIYGGDTFINKLGIKRTHHYFSLFLHDAPDGYVINYRNYRNIGYPRFWMDSSPYDLSGFVSLRPTSSRTPVNLHNLDCGSDDSNSVSVVRDRYFYLFNSGVINFFVESDYNLDLRDWRNEEPTFYSRSNSDLSNLFRSDKIQRQEEFIYDRTFSKENTENLLIPQSTDFDLSDEACQTNLKNRVIYSMPESTGQKADAWRVYLPLNYHDFAMADFGQLTAIKPMDNQQLMFLFDKSSPYITIGRDELKLDGSGQKITIGDSGLFAREPRPIAFTDNHIGNSQSKWGFNNTEHGIFYPSQRQGKLFKYTGKLDNITRNGMYYWFFNNLPSRLLQQFPDFKQADNPVIGTSIQTAFDSVCETYYVCKKDYEAKSGVTYDAINDRFLFGNKLVELGDPLYFDDASWTISFSPAANAFISWHDWHADWTLQSENRFMSVRNNAIWKHNERYDSFCNFYGVDYPFEIEMVVNNGQNNEILRSIEYFLDMGRYFNNGKDFQQQLDGNFDEMVVHNNEQCSGLLKLVLQNKKDVSQHFTYPKRNFALDYTEVLYNKEEQKHRVNMFTDIIKDRGEFTHNNIPIWVTNTNGYTKELNQVALDLSKPVQHQKRFRSLYHKILLRKLVSGDKKILFKFMNAKESNSFR